MPSASARAVSRVELRTGAEDVGAEPVVEGHRAEEHVDPLVADEPADESDPTGTRSGAHGPAARNRSTSTPRGRSSHSPVESLAPEDLTRLRVARVGPGRPAQGGPLQPAERRRVPLLDVLGRGEDEGHARGPQPAQDHDLGDGQPERLLVQIDQVPVPGSEQPPQRPRVVEEEIRMPAHRAHRFDEGIAVAR